MIQAIPVSIATQRKLIQLVVACAGPSFGAQDAEGIPAILRFADRDIELEQLSAEFERIGASGADVFEDFDSDTAVGFVTGYLEGDVTEDTVRSALREIFGNPFRPVAFAPSWRSESAVALARTAYDTRDFTLLPILADALEEAGCDHADTLAHCRDPKTTHARGCWVVDLVLNKS
jgi:hypothetical protein